MNKHAMATPMSKKKNRSEQNFISIKYSCGNLFPISLLMLTR